MLNWETLLRWLLPLYFITFFGLGFVWRSVRVWKQTGLNPYQLGHSESAYDFIGLLFRFTLFGLVGVTFGFAVWPALHDYAARIFWLEAWPFVYSGVALLAVALAWVLLAQAHMGRAWRIGIDAHTRTELIQTGPFAVSRNPIFLGMGVTLLGFFLVLPNALSLLTLVLGVVLMQVQVRLEEEHLFRLHGETYRNYQTQVRRWL